jgi:hypothetical protein
MVIEGIASQFCGLLNKGPEKNFRNGAFLAESVLRTKYIEDPQIISYGRTFGLEVETSWKIEQGQRTAQKFYIF